MRGAYDASEDGGVMDPAISLAFLRSSQNEDSRLQRVRPDYGILRIITQSSQ
jgi:signal transduction histidine kinase